MRGFKVKVGGGGRKEWIGERRRRVKKGSVA